MTHENFKHLRINYENPTCVEDTREVMGGLRSLIAIFPERNTQIITTSYGVYRCHWNDDKKHWDIRLIVSPKKNEVSSIFI